jgi:hypothetical protein
MICRFSSFVFLCVLFWGCCRVKTPKYMDRLYLDNRDSCIHLTPLEKTGHKKELDSIYVIKIFCLPQDSSSGFELVFLDFDKGRTSFPLYHLSSLDDVEINSSGDIDCLSFGKDGSINYQKNVKYLFYINRDELPCFTFYCEEDGHLMECP